MTHKHPVSKTEILKDLVDRNKAIPPKVTRLAGEMIIDTILENIVLGRPVVIRGFGSLIPRRYTGETSKKRVGLLFHPSPRLSRLVNNPEELTPGTHGMGRRPLRERPILPEADGERNPGEDPFVAGAEAAETPERFETFDTPETFETRETFETPETNREVPENPLDDDSTSAESGDWEDRGKDPGEVSGEDVPE
ncbi:MAG: hypothetical protein LBF41_09330 [Deltaproteobacteria bacterium]|jgi:nucleoid DNA-binding protein|nr:hypothetical protein [Deltaproteobacteria bacterium]